MYRVLFILLLFVAAAHAADAPVVAPPQDFMDYGVPQTIFLFLVAIVCSVVAAPVCILVYGLILFIILKIAGLFGVTPTALLMKLVQRQMMGKGKGLVWQLALLICLPAGVLGLWLAIWFFGIVYHGMSVVVMGCAVGAITTVGFIWLAKILLGGLKQRMMGGMQADMLAQMMRMRDRE
jgi:hypothetical protein